jgi:hypothetical protein
MTSENANPSRALHGAHTEDEPAGECRPFETAPKDGTEVLLIGPHRAVVAWWGDFYAADSEFGTVEHEPQWGWLGHGDCKQGPVWLRLATYVEPTHWMPIPEPS